MLMNIYTLYQFIIYHFAKLDSDDAKVQGVNISKQ